MPLALVVFRLLVLVAGLIPLGPSGASSFEPRLGSITLLLAAAGALIGIVRGSETRDRAACGFTGAMIGLLAAAVGFALIRSVESLLGELSVCDIAALGLARGCVRPGILAGPAPVPTDLDTPAGAHNMSAALHSLGLLPAIAAVVFAAGPVVAAQDEVSGPEATGNSGDSTVVVTAASQQEFPRIAVQFEVHQPDGSFLLDATREDFRVTEERSPSSRRHASSGANLPSRQQSSRRDRRIHPRHGRPRGRLVALVPRPAHGARGPGASSLVAEPRQACVGAGHSTPGRLLHAGIAS